MTKPLYIAICEDLKEDQNRLIEILNSSGIQTRISVFDCGEDLLSQYQIGSYDLIFMDIFMDGMTGIETVVEIRKIDASVSVAFTTTSLDYALESYRLEALKYIEKPVKARAVTELLHLAIIKKESAPKLHLKSKDREEDVPLTDIIFLEQRGIKYSVYLVGGVVLTFNGKIVNLLEQLEEGTFYQCHKSYVVNFAFVKSLNKEFLMFEMIDGENVHIRRDGFWKTKKAYEEFLFSKTRGLGNE